MEPERSCISKSMRSLSIILTAKSVMCWAYELKMNVNTGKYNSAGIKGLALFFSMG